MTDSVVCCDAEWENVALFALVAAAAISDTVEWFIWLTLVAVNEVVSSYKFEQKGGSNSIL